MISPNHKAKSAYPLSQQPLIKSFEDNENFDGENINPNVITPTTSRNKVNGLSCQQFQVESNGNQPNRSNSKSNQNVIEFGIDDVETDSVSIITNTNAATVSPIIAENPGCVEHVSSETIIVSHNLLSCYSTEEKTALLHQKYFPDADVDVSTRSEEISAYSEIKQFEDEYGRSQIDAPVETFSMNARVKSTEARQPLVQTSDESDSKPIRRFQWPSIVITLLGVAISILLASHCQLIRITPRKLIDQDHKFQSVSLSAHAHTKWSNAVTIKDHFAPIDFRGEFESFTSKAGAISNDNNKKDGIVLHSRKLIPVNRTSRHATKLNIVSILSVARQLVSAIMIQFKSKMHKVFDSLFLNIKKIIS